MLRGEAWHAQAACPAATRGTIYGLASMSWTGFKRRVRKWAELDVSLLLNVL
jgi:hypothetical protein